jgi:hypothetical protein
VVEECIRKAGRWPSDMTFDASTRGMRMKLEGRGEEDKRATGELSVESRDGTGGALAGAERGLRCCRGDFLHFSRSLASAGRPVVLAAFG